MIETYAAAVAVLAACSAIGQAAIALCGGREWSWLSPAIGLSLLAALCWAAARLPDGAAVGIPAAVALVAAAACLRLRALPACTAAAGAWVAAAAAAAASLPFLIEGRFGILGTGFNPDMSQHLLAAERLSAGVESGLQAQGYPLGPHAIVVALEKGMGIGLVQGFGGLSVAAAAVAALAALAAFPAGPMPRRVAAALVVGLPFLVASYFAQGAFKETLQALLVLAFVLALRQASRDPAWSERPLRLLPAALIALGSVYVYSFPGLAWPAAALLAWLLLERRLPLRPLLLALLVFAVGTMPELGRMLDFRHFETFDPRGPGLGNLFGQVSPLTALGVWFSGDFRVAPGDGAVPAVAFYAGAALALALLARGLASAARDREGAVLAGAGAAALVYLAARLTGTPYQAAKALEVAAPLLALAMLAPLAGAAWRLPRFAYLALAAASSLLAFANAPVGPTAHSPALAELRPLLGGGSTLALASAELLDAHGERYLLWELRGARVCVRPEAASGRRAPRGIRWVVAESGRGRPFADVALRREAGGWALWRAERPVRGPGPCPLIAVRQARGGAPGGG